ncbi:MAG: alpha/beta hydrolase [Bacteroidota bacterium]
MKNYLLLPALFLLFACSPKSEQEKMATPDYQGIQVDSTTLDYVIEGEGTPALVIGSHIYYPRTFSEELEKHIQLHHVDLRWFAEEYSPVNLEAYGIEEIVADIESARQQLGLEKPLLIGHSIHGTIAMEYAKRHQDKISGLVIIGSPAKHGNEAFDQAVADLWETAHPERKVLQDSLWEALQIQLAEDNSNDFAKAYVATSAQYWYDSLYDATWLWDRMTAHTELIGHLFGTVFHDYDMFRDSVKLNIPVWVGMGTYDYVIPYTLWEEEYESIPDFSFHLFEKSGHTPQLEEEALFNQRLLEWASNKSLITPTP